MSDLSRKRERERLPERHAPYFQRIGKGAYFGVRRDIAMEGTTSGDR